MEQFTQLPQVELRRLQVRVTATVFVRRHNLVDCCFRWRFIQRTNHCYVPASSLIWLAGDPDIAQTMIYEYIRFVSPVVTKCVQAGLWANRIAQSAVSNLVSSNDRSVASISLGSVIAQTPPPFAPLLPTSLPTRFLPTLPGPRPSHRFVPAS
jgi:hypothetical protein